MQNNVQSGPDVNVSTYLREMAAKRPFQRAVVCPTHHDMRGRAGYSHLTFRQLDRESDCLAHGLVKYGIKRGTRTILMVPSSMEFFVLTFALFKTGAVPVVVDPGMGLGRMLNCLAESKAAAFIGIPKAHVLRVLRPKFFQTVHTKITVGKRWFWGGPTLQNVRQTPWRSYPIAKTAGNETAAILFTTGSTGPAKGAVYTHGIFEAQVRHIQSHFKIEPGEIDLPTFPLFALFDPALGMTAVIPDMDPTKPAMVNPDNIIGPIISHGVTNMFASPALLNRVGRFGKQNNIRLATIKRVISAGAPALPDNLERFSRMLGKNTEIFPGYGATEAMPVAVMGSHEVLSKTRQLSEQGYGICVGRVLKGLEAKIIRISDDTIQQWSDDLVLPDGEIGEITVAGDLVTLQYFERKRDDMLSKINQSGRVWHRMGDLGWFDKEQRLWFCGRKSHRVITEKTVMFTIPCEAIFNNHPGVYRSALVGVGPKPKQKPVICIELEKSAKRTNKKKIKQELLELGRESILTEEIGTILFHKSFPVDIRHNSKIFREKLAVWAERKISVKSRKHEI
jgi:acyl-CoA synthetase (AMP-forming)/AMP-acid ligase II